MSIRKLLIIGFGILLSVNVFGQRNVTERADRDFEDQKYSVAVEEYKKAYSKVKDRDRKNVIRFKMAECYRLMNNSKRAEATYKGLVRTKYYKEKPEILLHYAEMLKENEKYDDAISQFAEYIKLRPDDPRGSDGLKSCHMQQEWVKHPTNHQISSPKGVNSRDDDFAPCYASENYNDLIFTSNREGATGKAEDEWTGKNFTDLFYTRMDRKGEWSTPTLLDTEENINTETNEGIATYNSTFTTLYFTRCGNAKNAKSGCHIYKAKKQGRSFGTPEVVPLGGDSTSSIGHPTLSEDGLMIIFAADFSGGQGGKDLWYATRKKSSDKFGRAKNLGPVINTTEDELFPFLRNDTILYFASNGHIGMGGLDIFKSTRDGESWSIPKNLGSPMNSNKDDYAIIFNPEAEEEGYFTSNRKEYENIRSKGGDDIWYFIVPPVEFTISGIVKDNRTLQFIEGADVKMVGSDGTSIITKTNSIGRYEFNNKQVNKQTTYELAVSDTGYFSVKGTITTVGIERSKDFVRDFMLEPIPKKPIVLPEILYDLAKWDLKPQYQDSLQGLITTLDENPTLIVEIASHTDSRDSDERNDILSQKRAQSVVDYLILRGIDPDRLVAKGYGERVPRKLDRNYYMNNTLVLDSGAVLNDDLINSLSTKNEKEFAHQLNRRTEFSVLSNDFVPKEKLGEVKVPKIEVVVNPEAEMNSVPLIFDENGKYGVEAIVNGYSTDVYVDKRLNKPYISLEDALKLLKEGAISKGDFAGKVNEVLANSSIADGAVFLIEDMKVLDHHISLFEVTVSYKIKKGFYVDEATFSLLGKFTLDEENKLMIFK